MEAERALHPIEFSQDLERTMRRAAEAKADSLRAMGAPAHLIRDYDHYSAVGMFPCETPTDPATERERDADD